MTWNPVTGCTKVSPGCKHCYAEIMSRRLLAMGAARYQNGFELTLHEEALDQPFAWRKPRTVFVNSMSDLFQEQVPLTFIQRVFETMRNCPQHQFQILTKRAERLVEVAPELEWSPNIWMGVSVETQEYAYRARLLKGVPASVRFISVEPLLARIDRLPLTGIHWVIVGGESGPGARVMKSAWVESIYRQCRNRDVPFFFKQWGGVQKHRTGRELFGQVFDEMPSLQHTSGSSITLN
jgi:protein gp37